MKKSIATTVLVLLLSVNALACADGAHHGSVSKEAKKAKVLTKKHGHAEKPKVTTTTTATTK